MKINWSEKSKDDLRDILSYVASNFGCKKANDVLVEIRSTVGLLKDFPNIGKSFVQDGELGIEYFSLASKLNNIVYYIDGETVIIVSIWQNRQDINALVERLSQ